MKHLFWAAFLGVAACYAAADHQGGAFVILAVLALYIVFPSGEQTHDRQFRIAHHARRFSAAGFFWMLAAWRSIREGSIRPLAHHAEWRTAWRLARG
jgi:uncharacterized membrane protein YozB (DUF420 family)